MNKIKKWLLIILVVVIIIDVVVIYWPLIELTINNYLDGDSPEVRSHYRHQGYP